MTNIPFVFHKPMNKDELITVEHHPEVNISFGMTMAKGFDPMPIRPLLTNLHLTAPFPIKYVKELWHDPNVKHNYDTLSDPAIAAILQYEEKKALQTTSSSSASSANIDDNNANSTNLSTIIGHTPDQHILKQHNILMNRNSIRNLLKYLLNFFPEWYSYREKRYFTLLNQDFILDMEKIGSLVIIQSSDRYDAEAGGYGKGFEDAVLASSSLPPANNLTNDPQDDDKSNDKYYKISSYSFGNHCPILIKYEVDAEMKIEEKDKDDNENDEDEYITIELKSVKYNAKFPTLSKDFYMNLWSQMIFANTTIAKIGYRNQSMNEDENIIVKYVTMTIGEVQTHAGITEFQANQLFTSMEQILKWIYDEFSALHQHHQQEQNSSSSVTGAVPFFGQLVYSHATNSMSIQTKNAQNETILQLPILSNEMRMNLRSILL